MVNNFFCFFVIFLFLLCPFLVVGSVKLHLPYYLLFFSTLFVLYKTIFTKKIDKSLFLFINIVFLLFFWFFSISLLYSNLDSEFLYYILCIVPVLFFSILLNDKIFKDVDEESLIFLIFLVGTIHAIIMTASFFIPSFSNFLYSFIPLGEKGLEFIETNTRSPGLTGGGGDHLSIFQAFCIYCGVKYYIINKFSTIRTVLFLVSLSFLLMSIFLSARTGFVILLFLLAWDVFYTFFFKSSSFKDKIKSFNVYIFILFFVSLVLVVIYFFLKESSYLRFFNRAFEVFINYENNGKLETNSSNTLFDMIMLPDSTIHFLFGNGYFGRGEGYYLESDIGYIRMLHGGGLLGLFFLFSPMVFIFSFVLRTNLKSVQLVREVTIALLMTLVIANFKVVHYFGMQETYKLLIFLFTFIVFKLRNDLLSTS